MYEVVKDLDPAQIGVAFDIGHAWVVHGEDWRRHFEKLKPHIQVAYVKDVQRPPAGCPLARAKLPPPVTSSC